MNREQIIKALGCCITGYCYQQECPLAGDYDDDIGKCTSLLAQNALSLIREMEIELEAMRTAANSLKMHYERAVEENGRLRDATEKIIRKKAKVNDYWQRDVRNYRMAKGYSYNERDVDNFLRGYNEAVEDMLLILKPSASVLPETCVECGEIIPEGRQVCPSCINKTNKKTKKARKESEKRAEN